MLRRKNHLSLAEKNALKNQVVIYRFCAYKTHKDYIEGKHYITEDFLNLTELRFFSIDLEKTEKKVYKDFCSDYFMIVVKPKHLKIQK